MNRLVEQGLQFLARKFVFFAIYLHYLRGRDGGSRRNGFIKNFQDNQQHQQDTLVAVWDFTFWPYALGDILNWNICICCEALKRGKKNVDVIIIADETRPAPKVQSYISKFTYERFLLDIMPAFFTNPMLNNLKIYKSRNEFEINSINATFEQYEMSPAFGSYAEQLHLSSLNQRNKPYAGEFKTINDYYQNKGHIPLLKTLNGIETIGHNLKAGFPQDVFFVCLHLRRRQAEGTTVTNEANLSRDADFELWISFLQKVASEYPNVKFLLVGRHEELDRRILRLNNVIFLKHYGYSLAGELNSIVEADLFMGSNSGPAIMAMLSKVPYLIFQTVSGEKASARVWDTEIGAKQLIFAQPNQEIVWGPQTVDTVFNEFKQMYLKLRPRDKGDTINVA